MNRRWLIGVGVVAALAAAGLLTTAIAQSPHVIKAVDPSGDPPAADRYWEPGIQDGPAGTIEAEIGDSMSWEFDQAGEAHNLLLKPPSGERIHLSEGVEGCDGTGDFGGRCPPDTPPITYTFEEGAEEGTYVYYCTLHNGNPEGTSGMSGRIVIGEPNGGPEFMPNPTEVGPPWEFGTEPPRMTRVNANGIRRGVRLRFRLSHPGRAKVTVRRRGRVVLNRRLNRLPEGVTRRKISGKRLTRGRHRVILKAWDKWGQRARPKVVRRAVRLRY